MWIEHASNFTLPNLQDLSIGNQDTISAQSLVMLAQTTQLNNMTRLSLAEVTYNAPAIKALSKATWLPQLKELNLYDRTGTSKATFAKLLSTKRFEHIETLSIGRLNLRSKDLKALANNPSMSTLRHLKLIYEYNIEGGLAHILNTDVFRLNRLEMWVCNLNEDDLLAIDHPNTLHMHTLELIQCTLSNKAFQTMAQSPNLANLVELSVKRCRLDSPSIEAIATSKHLKNLRILDLGNHLEETEVHMLAYSEHLHPDVRAVFLQHLSEA
jgi:hypothetical protein